MLFTVTGVLLPLDNLDPNSQGWDFISISTEVFTDGFVHGHSVESNSPRREDDAPSTNATATVTTYIIPVKIVITNRNGTKSTYDPAHVLSDGNTVTTNTVDSPLFDSTTTYRQGGVDVGITQYIDAYQGANFWGTLQSNLNWHLLLNPTVLAEQTLSPTRTKGETGSVFGFTAALVNINWFDAQVPNLINKLGIQPNQFPAFLLDDTYLTQGGQCCIGGYHSSEGILENGDPLEGNANFGGFPYSLHGFTYNLQDLVTLPYFGAPTSTSVNGWLSFQGESLGVCSNGS